MPSVFFDMSENFSVKQKNYMQHRAEGKPSARRKTCRKHFAVGVR